MASTKPPPNLPPATSVTASWAVSGDTAPNATLHGQALRGLRRRLNSLAGLTQLAVRRLVHYSGLSVLALIGIILAVGLVTSNSFFAQAVDRVMMQRELAEYSRITGRPLFAARVFAPSSPSVPLTLERAEALGDHVADTVASEVGLPVKDSVMLVDSGVFHLQAAPDDPRYTADRPLTDASIAYMTDVEDQIDVTSGQSMATAASAGALEVWMPAPLAAELGAHVGETYLLARSGMDTAIPIVLAGFWQASEADSAYWPRNPEQTMQGTLLVRRQDYLTLLEPLLDVKVRTATWQIVLNERKAVPADARNYKAGFDRAAVILPRYLPDARLTSPTLSLEKFVVRQTALTTLLLGFNLPALGFLLYFLVLTSAVIAYWQQRETSLLRSRGISRSSVLNFTAVEELLLFVIGAPLGWLLGLALARLMGYSVSFLSFDWRPPLPVSLNGLSIRLTLITLAVVLIAKLWTVAGSANQTVVTQQREHARPTRGPFWYRNYLDLVLILPTVYAYQQLVRRGWLGALVQDRPGDLYQDPLLILVPGLFIITLALVAMRTFPLFMRLLDYVAGRLPAFTSYLALRQLGRQSHSYINPLLLVIVSLALGVYTVSMAASMDQWLEDRIYYAAGADLSFTPITEGQASGLGSASAGADWIPPIDEFKALPGVESAARVGDYLVEISPSGAQGPKYSGRYLGIDRIDFPLAAWYRSDLSRESLGALMNRLAAAPDGVLVSQDFLTTNGLRIGDKIHLLVIPDAGLSVRDQFTIVGVYEYFPTVYEDEPTVIGNLEYIFSYFGVTLPHDIWLDLQEGARGDDVLTAVDALGIKAINVQDTGQSLAEEQAKMERIGVFGTLSISFIAATVMAAVGLLTYSYASLNERLFQFSVLRAIGLRRGQIVGQVALEYAILTTFGAVMGVLSGTLAATMFVPLFRVSAGAAAPLPPLIPVIARSQIILLAVLFAGLMISLEVIVISSAFRRRLFKTLRLGHLT